MRLTLALVSLTLAAPVRAEEPADLLAGGDLGANWVTKGNWKLQADGSVSLTPRDGETGWARFDAYLWSKQSFADFECSFEAKLPPKGNSGFYFRISDTANPVKNGIEVQIIDSGKKPRGAKNLTDHDAGGLIPSVPPTLGNALPAGEWNAYRVTAKGDKLTVELNGEVVNEVDLSQPKLNERSKVGVIGFQDHGLPLSLRNIRVRELK